jgi:hypothetical protein
MVRGILPLVLVCALAGAPFATEVCEMTCAATVEHAGMVHSVAPHASHVSDQSCHDASLSGEPKMAALPHACGHESEGQPPAASIRGTLNGMAAIPLAMVSASATALDGSPSLTFRYSVHSQVGPGPISLRFVMPLRI